MTKFEKWFISRVFKREVTQGPNHAQNIADIYAMVKSAAEKEFTEDNVPTLEFFLQDRFLESCPELEFKKNLQDIVDSGELVKIEPKNVKPKNVKVDLFCEAFVKADKRICYAPAKHVYYPTGHLLCEKCYQLFSDDKEKILLPTRNFGRAYQEQKIRESL